MATEAIAQMTLSVAEEEAKTMSDDEALSAPESSIEREEDIDDAAAHLEEADPSAKSPDEYLAELQPKLAELEATWNAKRAAGLIKESIKKHKVKGIKFPSAVLHIKMKAEKKHRIWVSQGLFPATPAQIRAAWTEAPRLDWDKAGMKTLRIHKELIPGVLYITHTTTPVLAGGLVSPREFLSVDHHTMTDGRWMMAATSTLHPEVPLPSGKELNRGTIFIAKAEAVTVPPDVVFAELAALKNAPKKLEPLKAVANWSRFTFTIQMTTGGKIPRRLVDGATQEESRKRFNALREYLFARHG